MATDAAPDSAGPQVVPLRKLSEELAHLQATFAERSMQLHEVIAVLHGRAYLLLVMLLALPFVTPIPLPGLSTPFGLVIALVALRLVLGQTPWLPQRLLHTRLPAGFFGRLIALTRRVVSWFEKLLRPRAPWVTGRTVLLRLHALVMLVSGLVLLLPLPIPFSNTFPAWAIMLIAGGLLERDGVAVLVGYVTFAAGALYFYLLGESMQKLLEAAKQTLFP